MLLNSVILILQETLEAALLIGVLLAISAHLRSSLRWLWYGLSLGAIIAFFCAINMSTLSAWFDYAGQEVLNAIMQSMICVFIIVLVWLISSVRPLPIAASHAYGNRFAQLCCLIIMLAVIREGQEIMLYLSGFLGNVEHVQKVFIGSGIGFGIGASVGILLFYGLLALPTAWQKPAMLTLLALFAGNMLAQSAVQLTQVDWIAQTAPLWDSSAWLAEDSMLGELLYALIGYESRPTAAQMLSYVSGISLVWLAALGGTYYAKQQNLHGHSADAITSGACVK
ncbi:FTR1 family protein [Porticoccaceae bacterium]|nr:FTR1 family protein [Porticoccaceae bacterium]